MEPPDGYPAKNWIAHKAPTTKRPLPNLMETATEQDYADLGRAVSEAMQADLNFEVFVLQRLLARLPGAEWALA